MINDEPAGESGGGNGPRRPVISIEQAREVTGLDLVSARTVAALDGHSYHELEQGSESKSHQSAREEAIEFFCSIGYEVFPEGVGVNGAYTLADFLAVRPGRVVFVEVLTDSNVTDETLQKKAQLQQHGELCFVLFSGTKRAHEVALLAAKQKVMSWADVLYCRLDGYTGNSMEVHENVTVIYDTTRSQGIRVALTFAKSGRKVVVSIRFLTHLYRNPRHVLLTHIVGSVTYQYEKIFLDLFERLARETPWRIKYTSKYNKKVAFRAMRRATGVKMVGLGDQVVARLRSEYRGSEAIEPRFDETYFPWTRDLPPDDFYGVFVFEKTGPEALKALLTLLRAYPLTLEYDETELQAHLKHLGRQPVTAGTALA